ncbi:DUF6383 domain-containing protein, partial [uncultured Parabacteroides sp.]|uniref:DUF6383 domain-containing protein n=1 Tax=uncultured Parabacteroides sp. TaxID=512312 RepID=UPI0025F76D26
IMNKRFSTLLAAALVAGGFSFNVMAAAGPGAVKDGEFTFLEVGSGVMAIDADGTLKEDTKPTSSSTMDVINAALWKVTVIPGADITGVPTYKFQNKKTGQMLSVKLQNDQAAAAGIATSSAAAKIGAGNSTWAWDDTKGLYAVVGDSTFYFTTGLKLAAAHKTATGQVTYLPVGYTALNIEHTLTADEFNTLTKGKLYFNGGKDVSTGNTNILTANTWTAETKIGSTTSNYLNLKNASGKYLVVDTALYSGTTSAADPAFVLNVDTVYKKSTLPAGVNENDPAFQRVREFYEFKADYVVAKDSLVLSIAKVPTYSDVKQDGSNWKGTATAYAGQVILRNLANATVLTVEKTANLATKAYVVEPLIQPTPGNIGGTAKIAPNKVYYVANMNEYVGAAKNPGYGRFFDYNFPNQAKYLAEGQDFNVFSQFVVYATPGTDNGNYTVKTRYNGITTWEGVADSLANGNIVFGDDTLKFVDANIEYKGAAQYIGYHANDHALANKQFKIQSASPLLNDDMFLHMKKDSTMTLKAGEVLYTMKRVNTLKFEETAIKDAVDPLAWDVYTIETDKGEYLIMDKDGRYILTADPEIYNYTVQYNYETSKVTTKSFIATGFAFIPTEAADKYVIMPTFPRVKVAADQSKKLNEIAVSCEYSSVPGQTADNATVTSTNTVPDAMKNSMITVNTNTGDLERFTLGTAKYDLFYVAEEEDPQSLFSMPKHIQLETTNNQFVTVNAKNEALVVAENALKSANYTSEDFTFWLDTAAYERNGEVLVAPYYYVTKGVSADEEAGVEAHRLYMYNATDSAENATVDKEQYKAYGATRVIFREALRYGADSLIVAGDTLTLDGKKTATIAEPKKGVADFRFNFLQAKDEAAGVYNIKSGNDYLRNLNGVLVVSTLEEGVMVTVNAAEAPTANGGVEVSEVMVIAGEGQVTVAGAAGKKVVISNILGQPVANTVLTSDNAVIAAPQGVVVVAVEGEEAVKAIIK